MPETHRRAGSGARFVAVCFVVASIAAACGGTAEPSGGSATPGTVRATSNPATTVAPAPNAPLVVDAALLGVLPTSVAGVPMQPAPDAAAGMIGDADLAKSASAIAIGVVTAAGDSRGDDFASSAVIQLRPGVLTDTFYREWREAYDRAACEPAGGVASHAQQSISGHTVEVNVCREGARTYHTLLAGDRLVSITAVGDGKFGDLVMAGLRQ